MAIWPLLLNVTVILLVISTVLKSIKSHYLLNLKNVYSSKLSHALPFRKHQVGNVHREVVQSQIILISLNHGVISQHSLTEGAYGEVWLRQLLLMQMEGTGKKKKKATRKHKFGS